MPACHWHKLLLVVALLGAAQLLEAGERDALRERLGAAERLVVGGSELYAAGTLGPFYAGRDYEPLWFRHGAPTRMLLTLPDAIRAAAAEGLVPDHYHLRALERGLALWRRGDRSRQARAELELLASDAFLTLAGHYAHGKVDPAEINRSWTLRRPDVALESLLEALARGAYADPGEALAKQLPDHVDYARLRERLALYRRLERDWRFAPLADGEPLRQGSHDGRVAALAARLEQLGDLEAHRVDRAHFDPALDLAVRRFQQRHGLAADGVVGPLTLAALNLAIEERIDRVRVNLERWRWLPDDLGAEHILVNIAGFYMVLVSDDVEVMRQRVVVGLPYRRTPVFSDRMTYLVLNPSWEVPPGIARREHLPKIRRDPGYLERMGFTLLENWGENERVIDPERVDWAAHANGRMPYRLRQRPGPDNAMGQVKFMFPNRHNVYLHDTPSRGLFARNARAASAGCIRLEKPLALAEWVLGGPRRDTAMTGDEIAQILEGGEETRVNLPRPVRIHLMYWTAWVERDGRTHYRDDIYERDGPLLEALDAGRHR
ncbi:MAG: L,D-transpeptidase family protein [Gammaproteobacteria bacterium]|nr:L,D-transpeptidase family protein [Gammaproteobacteria bacterium]